MYKFVVGEISSARKNDWYLKDENPYAVWEGEELVTEICYVHSWCTADEYLRDHVDVDWGSIAWKGNQEEIANLFKFCRWDCAKLSVLEKNKDYAVVFIESAGEF